MNLAQNKQETSVLLKDDAWVAVRVASEARSGVENLERTATKLQEELPRKAVSPRCFRTEAGACLRPPPSQPNKTTEAISLTDLSRNKAELRAEGRHTKSGAFMAPLVESHSSSPTHRTPPDPPHTTPAPLPPLLLQLLLPTNCLPDRVVAKDCFRQ